MRGLPGYAALLGDVVASRAHEDRAKLQDLLEETFRWIRSEVPAAQPLGPTIGDEFQALFSSAADALLATMLLRLRLIGRADVRFGVGWGLLTAFDARRAPYGQDGPAWWAARAAIERVAAAQRSRDGAHGMRTAFVIGEESGPAVAIDSLPEPRSLDVAEPAVNALLVLRDEAITRMDGRDARIVLQMLGGTTQDEIARREGISQAAVSQRLARNGGAALRHSHKLLEEALG